ncbi:MAG: gamma-mobile-trio recombinase GmtY [Mucilaginibacter sp.]
MGYVIQRIVSYRNDRTGKKYDLPALFTETGLIISHLRYLSTKSNKSPSWITRSAFSLRLLIQYLNANENCFEQTTELLQSFTDCLTTGTIDYQQMDDPSGLYWKPRDVKDANTILSHITQYTDYLSLQKGYKENMVNPFSKATSMEQRLNWCAYYHKHAHVFLNHLSDASEAQKIIIRQRIVTGQKEPKIENEKVRKFPEKMFSDLLYKGFIKPYSNIGMPEQERLDYKNIAIAILLNNGGLRKSEVFHIYASDITQHPTNRGALVRVYHPSFGASPEQQYKNRKEFLQAKYGLKPRTDYQLSERLFAGWKTPLLTSTRNYFEVIFAPSEASKLFIDIYAKYLKFQRVNPPGERQHPFAFTNQNGDPETLKNYQRMHKLAVERIGLICSKDQGTSEHGHRHSYGYRLAQLGFTQVEIQKAMHHKSPNSCLVYTQPTTDDIVKRMQAIESTI